MNKAQKTKSIDLSEILKTYMGKWVALSKDERKVLASGELLKDVFEQVKKQGFEEPIFLKVPPAFLPFTGPAY